MKYFRVKGWSGWEKDTIFKGDSKKDPNLQYFNHAYQEWKPINGPDSAGSSGINYRNLSTIDYEWQLSITNNNAKAIEEARKNIFYRKVLDE